MQTGRIERKGRKDQARKEEKRQKRTQQLRTPTLSPTLPVLSHSTPNFSFPFNSYSSEFRRTLTSPPILCPSPFILLSSSSPSPTPSSSDVLGTDHPNSFDHRTRGKRIDQDSTGTFIEKGWIGNLLKRRSRSMRYELGFLYEYFDVFSEGG